MAPPTRTTPFSASSTLVVLNEACAQVGLDPAGAELLRLGENAIYRLSCTPVVVRIARSSRLWDDATKEVSVAQWLAVEGVPAARVWPIDQPLDVAGHPVTFWHYIAGRRAAVLRDGRGSQLDAQVHRPGVDEQRPSSGTVEDRNTARGTTTENERGSGRPPGRSRIATPAAGRS